MASLAALRRQNPIGRIANSPETSAVGSGPTLSSDGNPKRASICCFVRCNGAISSDRYNHAAIIISTDWLRIIRLMILSHLLIGSNLVRRAAYGRVSSNGADWF